MEIFLTILFLIIGLLLLIFAGNLFVDKATWIAKKCHIPPLIMGATVVSLATTMPELITCIISCIEGKFDLSIGNAVGSVICNTALIAGLTITAMPKANPKSNSNLKFWLLIITNLVLILYGINQCISFTEGIGLLIIEVFFFIVNILDAKKEMNIYAKKQEQKLDLNNDNIISDEERALEKPKNKKLLWKNISLFIVGAIGIGGGAYLLVGSATRLASIIGISDMVIGLTIVAIGTSLPELITAILSIKKKNAHLGLGNIVGANMLNLGLLIGISALSSGSIGLQLSKETLFITFPISFLCIGLLIIPVLIKHKTYRWQGISLLVVYILYLIYLTLSSAFGIVL